MCFQAEDGIRGRVRSRGLGDVYKSQPFVELLLQQLLGGQVELILPGVDVGVFRQGEVDDCLLYTSDAADERSSVDLGGSRIIKKKTQRVAGAGPRMSYAAPSQTHAPGSTINHS